MRSPTVLSSLTARSATSLPTTLFTSRSLGLAASARRASSRSRSAALRGAPESAPLLPDPSLEREAEGRRRPKGLARRLARRLFFESAAGDAAAAVLAAACPRLLVFLAELAARCGVAGPSVN